MSRCFFLFRGRPGVHISESSVSKTKLSDCVLDPSLYCIYEPESTKSVHSPKLHRAFKTLEHQCVSETPGLQRTF